MNLQSAHLKALVALLFILGPSVLLAQIIERPKASLELCFQSESGTNGSAVTYDPNSGNYFALIAGNSSFPLEVFNRAGNSIYQTECGTDMRGLWWNPKSKQLEGNGYGSEGIVGINLDEQGFPSVGNSTIFSGADYQPESNSCGVFDGKKYVWYYSDGSFLMYTRKSGEKTKSIGVTGISSLQTINSTSMIYTGIKGMELGLLDYQSKKVLLFNKKTGSLSATIELPTSAITHYSFRFAYANKHVLLYDVDTRCWSGYQIVQ